MTTKNNDQTYIDAASLTMGRTLGQMFTGMIDEGLTRDEALDVLREYAVALALRPKDNEPEA